MIRPDDRDDAMRELLRQPRPLADDAVRAARGYRAVHAAWRGNPRRPPPPGAGGDPADGTRHGGRGVAIAAAAVLVVAIGLTLVTRLRERGAPQTAAPI